MIFQQLFEAESCTYSYLLGCEQSRQAVLIDPVESEVTRYIEALNSLGLTLAYTLETHVHADHVTAADALRQRLGSQASSTVMQVCFAVIYRWPMARI